MHTDLRAISLLGILSLALIGLAGCGEKRIHVSTASGAPGDEVALEPIDENSGIKTTPGLANALVDELNLLSRTPEDENASGESTKLGMGNESINMAHESTDSTKQAGSLGSSSDNANSASENGLSDHESPFNPLAGGQDFSAQSRSSLENPLDSSTGNNGGESDSRSTLFPEDSSGGFNEPLSANDSLSAEGIEAIPNTLQIAKAEPSDGLHERMNQMKQEELSAAAAGLEDVFFQFDSWTLTQEGKQSLKRALGWFDQNSSSNLIIEGHADQRGTQAYNMVLAKKRAVAVYDYLSQSGVNASRLAVISYGKDKPFCQDTTEVCHQLNRRGHLLIPNR